MKRIVLIAALIIATIGFSAKAQFADADITPMATTVGIRIISGNDTTQIHPIKYYKQKIGSGAFLAGLTYGAAKAKNKNFYKGSTSPNKVKVGDRIRFSFGEIPVEYLAALYMFGPQYSIRNYSLCRFDAKKDRRELTTGEFSLWSGSDVGTKESNDVAFEVVTVEPNVYEAIVTHAAPGEYCFLFTDNGVGAYTNLFDFSVMPDGQAETPAAKKKDKKRNKSKEGDDIY